MSVKFSTMIVLWSGFKGRIGVKLILHVYLLHILYMYIFVLLMAFL